MTYVTAFPDMAEDECCAAMAARSSGWEDVSWANEQCPSFMCDVFVLWIDCADPARREFSNGPRFCMQCEGETVLETDEWADVLAFMDEGKRDFPPYAYRELDV